MYHVSGVALHMCSIQVEVVKFSQTMIAERT